MLFKEIDNAILKCKNFLSNCKLEDPEIEIYLTSYLLLITYSNFESYIRDAIIKYLCKNYEDIDLKNYVNFSTKRLVRSITIKEIGKLLKEINPKLKKIFTEYQQKNQQIANSYDSLLTNRHQVAHTNGAKITMSDFLNYYKDAKKLFVQLNKILNIN